MSQTEPHHSILLVEDEAISRRALATVLRASGFEAQAVGSAEEALKLILAGGHPEFALVDLDLPGMNGVQLIEWLNRQCPAIPAILITASSRQRLSLLVAHHHIRYMRKPIDIDRLLNLLVPGDFSI